MQNPDALAALSELEKIRQTIGSDCIELKRCKAGSKRWHELYDSIEVMEAEARLLSAKIRESLTTKLVVDLKIPIDAVIRKWLVHEGDFVQKDQSVVEVEGDENDAEIIAPVTGHVVKILAVEGSAVSVHAVIALIAPTPAL